MEADFAGPKLNMVFREGQDVVIPCTYPPEIVNWTNFSLSVKSSRDDSIVSAAVDITQLVASHKVTFTFTAAQTRLMHDHSRYAIWANDPTGKHTPLVAGFVDMRDEIKA